MKNFTLTAAELGSLREDLGRRLPPKLRTSLDKLDLDPAKFIRNRDELRPGAPYYPFMAGMRAVGEFSFDTACRIHSLHYRWYPGIGTGGGIRVFTDTAEDGDRCYCREELVEKLCRLLCCGTAAADKAFIQLFGALPDLETALRRNTPMVRLAEAEIRRMPLPEAFRDSTAWCDPASAARELPRDWYIHLQIADRQLERYRWVIREYGSQMYRVAVSGDAATRKVREMRETRGEFIRRHSAETLRALWRDSGVGLLGERRLKREVFMLGVCRALGIAPLWRFCAGA